MFPFELVCVELVSKVRSVEYEGKRWGKSFLCFSVFHHCCQYSFLHHFNTNKRKPEEDPRNCTLQSTIWQRRNQKDIQDEKKKIPGVRILGIRVSYSHKFSFCRGLQKNTHKDKNNSGDELFLFQAFADGWFSRYITFMTTSWSNVTHLEINSQAFSTEGCDDVLLWFFELFLPFIFFPLHTLVGIEWIIRERIAENFIWLGSKKKDFLSHRMYLV